MFKKIASVIWTGLSIMAWLISVISIIWSFIGFVDEMCYKTNRMRYPYKDGSKR